MAAVIDFASRRVERPPAAPGKRHPREMIYLWKTNEYLLEAAQKASEAALAYRWAAHYDDSLPEGEWERRDKAYERAEDAERECELRLMLTPVTSKKALKWKIERQRRPWIWRTREQWLPILNDDCKRMRVDPDTVVEQPSEVEMRTKQTLQGIREAVAMYAVSDADPELKRLVQGVLGPPLS